jgi:hypothetical protein
MILERSHVRTSRRLRPIKWFHIAHTVYVQNVDEMDPATFIVLLILRSLDTTSIASPTVVPASLTDKLKPLLAKREIKVQSCILLDDDPSYLLQMIR